MTKKIVSILLILVLAFSLFAGSAFAAAGDSSGTFADFPYVRFTYATGNVLISRAADSSVVTLYSFSRSSSADSTFSVLYILPSILNSGSITLASGFSNNSYVSSVSTYDIYAYSSAGRLVQSFSSVPLDSPCSLSSPCQFIRLCFTVSYPSAATFRSFAFYPTSFSYSNFVYLSPGGSYDPTLDQDILDGVTAISKSLLNLEDGPYYGVTDVTVDSNGDLQHTLIRSASLQDLLNALGIAGSDTNQVLRGIYNNFGSYFTLYSIADATSGTTQVYRGLPQYVNALGMEVTDGINRLQRDNVLLYQQGENIQDALYTDKSDNQPWSVAQWLKDIYTAITSFFSSFWSPAEIDLKTAAEDGMQSAADNGNAASRSQVDAVNSAADAFKEFGSTGNIGSGDVMDIFSDGASYDFFSQTTKDNLAYHPPAGSQRLLRSSSAPVESYQGEEEYVDELDDKLSYWREVLGLP